MRRWQSVTPIDFSLVRAVVLVSGIAITACDDDHVSNVTTPTGPTVYVCYGAGTGIATVQNIQQSDLAKYKGLGAYVAQYTVDKTSTANDSMHFRTITSAVAAARALRVARNETESAACRITINVASGTYNGSTAASTDPTFERFPIVIDVPKLSIIGALKMGLDAQGRATGDGTSADASTIIPIPALLNVGAQVVASEELFVVNSHITGSKGDDAIIEGMVLRSGHASTDTTHGGQAVLALRVNNLVIRGNRVDGNFTERLDLRATSALVERNYLAGTGSSCDICLAGPGTYTARDNRVIAGGLDGILALPTTVLPVPAIIEQYTPPAQAMLVATITNNETRGHEAVPVGVGIRFATMGSGAPNTSGATTATVTGNTIVNNRFGFFVEAGFPVAGGALRGDMDLTTSGNTISGSCEIDFMTAFTRHSAALGVNSRPYLANSTYKLTLGADIPFANAWYANAAGNGNTFVVNGATIASGVKVSYDAARLCSSATAADTSVRNITVTAADNGDSQVGPAGTLLSNQLRVLVKTGTVLRVGVPVQWTTATGTITATSFTDATGIATAQWTLGTKLGAQTATATVQSATPASVVFNATAQAPPVGITSRSSSL